MTRQESAQAVISAVNALNKALVACAEHRGLMVEFETHHNDRGYQLVGSPLVDHRSVTHVSVSVTEMLASVPPIGG